jgi:hypothetical protein
MPSQTVASTWVRRSEKQRQYILDGYCSFYWSHIPPSKNWQDWGSTWDYAARLQARYHRYVNYCNEVLPGWTRVQEINFADNSTEVVEVCKCGKHTRQRMVTAPHGDVCF